MIIWRAPDNRDRAGLTPSAGSGGKSGVYDAGMGYDTTPLKGWMKRLRN
jgi:hypothetical protein